VITRATANVRIPGYKKLWWNLTESLRLKYENTLQQHSDADVLMERVRKVITAIASLADYTPVSVSESPKWIVIFQNMA
jgi:2C-methyl-D-erythritol 2,4-cyclodiphosphate synthase